MNPGSVNLEPFYSTYGANANRVRSDVAAVRQRFTNLLCEGDNYVQNNGTTLRLIKFAGTLPISYRGTVYHIPVTVWLPPAYPLQGPNLFVSPTADMAIKQQHQHVDSEGRCYLPSLSQWNPNNVQGLVAALTELQGVFAVNPPVYTKPKGAPSFSGPANPYAAAAQHGPQYAPQPPQPAYGVQPAYSAQPAYGAPQPGFANSPGGGGSLLEAQRREAKARCVDSVSAQCKTLASEMNQFMTMQSKLTDGEAEIADQFVRMDSHLKQVDAALQWTRKATAEVDQWIQEQKAKTQQLQTIDVDEVVLPVNALSEQLLESVAASQAIEDAIYVLTKALTSDDVKLDVETFAKEMRKLCSQQFIHLATIRKIHSVGIGMN